MSSDHRSGDPADGVEVEACEAPGLVVVRTGPDGWLLTVRIEGYDDEAGRDPDAPRFGPDHHPGLSGHYRSVLGG